MKISLIVATDPDGVIGREGRLPWSIPADLAHFRRVTMGKPVVMGRKTFESIGKPLRGRSNIVLTRQDDLEIPGCLIARSVEEALHLAAPTDEVMIAGGASVYGLFLPRADRIYWTLVGTRFSGDTRFPVSKLREWHEVDRIDHDPDERNPHPYSVRILDRA